MTDEPKVKPGAKGCKGCGRVLYVTDPDYCPDPECQAKAAKEKARDAARAQRAEERKAE